MASSCGTVLTVAESLLRAGEVTFSGCVMRIVQPSSSTDEHSSAHDPVLVHLAGIPPGTTEDTLSMYLENKRKSGGGPIRKLEYDDVSGTAVVCFEDDTGIA